MSNRTPTGLTRGTYERSLGLGPATSEEVADEMAAAADLCEGKGLQRVAALLRGIDITYKSNVVAERVRVTEAELVTDPVVGVMRQPLGRVIRGSTATIECIDDSLIRLDPRTEYAIVHRGRVPRP